MLRRLFGLILLAAALTAGPNAQNLQRPAGSTAPTGLLMGVIVDGLDGPPVADAEVTLGGAPVGTPNTKVLSDGEGRFVFMDLPSGTYRISATRRGYADGAYGQRRALTRGDVRGQSVTLAEAERVGDLKVPLWKLAAITGRVTDETGEPMGAVGVIALRRTIVAGKRNLGLYDIARTDDRGIYRLASLPPGDYVVGLPSTQAAAPESIVDLYREGRMNPGGSGFGRDVTFSGAATALGLFERSSGTRVGSHAFHSTLGLAPSAADGRMFVYPAQYYAAVSTAADASVIALRSGEERAGIDLSLNLVPTSRVSGRVTGPDGPLVAALTLVQESEDFATEWGLETATTMSDAAGRFTFLGVPAGRYRLTALWVQVPPGGGGSRGAPPPATAAAKAAPLPVLGGSTLTAAQTIAVGATDISDLAITVRAGFRISGRAEFAGAAPQPAPDAVRRMSATFDPADGRWVASAIVGRGQFDDQGVLSSYQLPPGRYYLRINNAPPGWTLKSAIVNGRDMSNAPVTLDRDVTGVTVTFTDRPASLSGQVQGATGTADASATVLIFPADSAAWIDYGSMPQRLRAVRVDPDGRYRTVGLPAGEYLVVAVADESSADFQDPDVLKALARSATAVTIGDGESRSVSLKTTAVSR